MTCLKTPRPQTLQGNHLPRLVQDGAQHRTMLKMTAVGMTIHRPVKVVDLVLQDLVPAEEHLVGDYQMEMTVVLVEEEVVAAEAEVDFVTLMETMIPIHHEVAVVAVEDLAEVIQKMMRVAVVTLVALEVALVGLNHPMKMETVSLVDLVEEEDLNHPMTTEMMVVVVVSEVGGVDLEGTEVALKMTNQDLDSEEVVEGSAAEGVDSTLLMTMIMKMKTLAEALVVKEAVEGSAAGEEALALQMTMMTMTPEDLVAGEVVEVSGEEEADLAQVVMMERKTQAQVVALAHGEEASVALNHLVMEILKDLAVEVVASGLMMTIMMVNHMDGGVVEGGGAEGASAAVTMTMVILTPQNLVRRIYKIIKY